MIRLCMYECVYVYVREREREKSGIIITKLKNHVLS